MQIAHSALSTVGIAGRRVVATGRLDGSSPHARGTLSGALEKLVLLRFIPAYAGNASAPGFRGRPSSVHPRIRGERASTRLMAHTVPGSSPHTRGTLRVPCCRRWHIRFIPAYAGNAHFCTCWHIACPVYPRIRGERRAEVVAVLDADGSSPHARGTHHADNRRSWRGRFIPACAGNAFGRAGKTRPAAVHPRIRGERVCAGFQGATQFGSSPHTRGTRQHALDGPHGTRFIPAYAGNAAGALL